MPKLADWVKESVTGTPGTGTITLGVAIAGYCRFQDNFVTGDKVYYEIEDGNNREEGYGTLTSGTPWTLARTTISRTIVSGVFDNTSPAAITLTSSAIVGISGSADTSGLVVGRAISTISSVVNCSTIMPLDDTIPQNTEGTEVITVSYTPIFADSILQIEAGFFGRTSGQWMVSNALFRDSVANALTANGLYTVTSTGAFSSTIYFEEVSGNTTARVYKLRCGPHAAGSFYINATNDGVRYYGGVANTYIKVTEIRQ